MIKNIYTKLRLLILCYNFLFSYSNLSAQSVSLIKAQKPKFISNLYYDSLGVTPSIYKGVQHTNDYHSKGHPYFLSQNMTNCEIIYNDFLYESIQGNYDLLKQSLIIKHDKLALNIVLEPRKISEFKIHGHVFEMLYLDSISGMTSGYYDKIVNQTVKLYVRREKQLNEDIQNNTIIKSLIDINKYYILKDGVFYKVSGKRSVLKVLVEHKKELKEYIQKQQISFRRFPEEGIKNIVKYYNELHNQL